MPRYFFNIYDGHEDIDEVGTVLPDFDAVRLHAFKSASRVFEEQTEINPTTTEWKMEVTDAGGSPLFILSFTDASVPWVLRQAEQTDGLDGPDD